MTLAVEHLPAEGGRAAFRRGLMSIKRRVRAARQKPLQYLTQKQGDRLLASINSTPHKCTNINTVIQPCFEAIPQLVILMRWPHSTVLYVQCSQ
jgi:hypothetical protein